MATLQTLEEALVEELRDLYSAEQQLVEALPKMAKAATNKKLRAGFTEHLKQTEGHVERLEQAFQLLNEKPKAQTCQAMKGLIREGSEIIAEDAVPDVHDAFLIAAAQKVEHYEIASYGTVISWAEVLGLTEVRNLLEQTLEEEKETNEKLTEISDTIVHAPVA